MKSEVPNDNIQFLNLEKLLIKKLNNINIKTINDLWKTNRTFLKNNNFTNEDINSIKIKLQLIGLDLNKKKY